MGNIRTPNSNLRWKDPTASIDKSAELRSEPGYQFHQTNGDVVPYYVPKIQRCYMEI